MPFKRKDCWQLDRALAPITSNHHLWPNHCESERSQFEVAGGTVSAAERVDLRRCLCFTGTLIVFSLLEVVV